MNAVPQYFQVEPSWDCSLHDRRGDALPGRIVFETRKLAGFAEAWAAIARDPDALDKYFSRILGKRYGFAVSGMSYRPVRTARGVPSPL